MGKARNKINNWKQYNRALVNRGAITFWVDDEAIHAWHCTKHHRKRGRRFQFSDVSIETALMIKGIFKLPLRALEGFINSVFSLMDIPLSSPTYSCISKRANTVEIAYRLPSKGPIEHVVIDATGLKVFGEGEWRIRQYGKEKRRRWRKLHLAVDARTHEVIAAELSLSCVGDNEVLPALLNPLRRKIFHVSADGAYDTKECHAVLRKKGISPSIPPRSNANYWETGHPRNKSVEALKGGKLTEWKISSGYHKRSLAETAMYRYKQLFAPKLALRAYNAQVGEILANVKAMNKVTKLGMPVH